MDHPHVPHLRGVLHLVDGARRRDRRDRCSCWPPTPPAGTLRRGHLRGEQRRPVRDLGDLPHGLLAPVDQGDAAPRRPLEHLPHHRRHLHAAVADPPAARRRADAADRRVDRRPRWRPHPQLLAHGTTLGVRADLRVPRLGRRVLHPASSPRPARFILSLIVSGGLLYTVGAVVYATKWPQLSDKWFGFHEMFHSFTIAGFLSHFSAIALAIVAFA